MTFQPGQISQSLTVPRWDDTLDENDETFNLLLSNAHHATLGLPASATVTIVDNDAPPTVQFGAPLYPVNAENPRVLVEVKLSAASGLTVTSIAVQSGGTASGTEFTVLAAENTRLLALATAQSAFVIDSAGTTYTGAQAAATITGTGAIATVNSDIDAVVAARAGYGADMGKFASASSALGLEASNAAGQYSSVMDTDYAVETTNMTRASIKNQAANAMLAQANQIPNQVLAMLRF